MDCKKFVMRNKHLIYCIIGLQIQPNVGLSLLLPSLLPLRYMSRSFSLSQKSDEMSLS